MTDAELFSLALREYRDATQDMREFDDLPIETQKILLWRAQWLKKSKQPDEQRGE